MLVMPDRVAVLRVAALQDAPGPGEAAGRRAAGVHHVLVDVLVAVIVSEDRRVVRAAVLGVRERFVAAGQRAAAVRRVRHAAFREGLQVVLERVRGQRGRLAGVVAVAVEVLAGRRGQRTRHVEVRRVVLLREHLGHAQSLPLADPRVDLAELAA